MTQNFKLPASILKADLIDKYNELLQAYQRKVAEAQEATKVRRETERRNDVEALELAEGVSVQSVIQNLGALRAHVGQAFNDLTDQLTAEAERLESLKRAVALQEARLQELQDVEVAADALSKLTAAYEERSSGVEVEFQTRLTELERVYAEKAAQLDREVTENREKWETERTKAEQQLAEARAAVEKERSREEADYVYERDRKRKLEQHEYEARKAALEQELTAKEKVVGESLSARAAEVGERETELAELQEQVAAFPERLQSELSRARKEAVAELNTSHAHALKMIEVERDWERRVAEQNAAHAVETIAALERRIESLHLELTAAQKQVQALADKTIEGASLSRAYQSVNQIALEQARRSKPKAKA